MRPQFAILIFLVAVLPSVAAEPQAGVVKTVRGDIVIVRKNTPLRCTEGVHVFPGDMIRTQAGASAGVILLDGTRLAVGENSEVVIQGYMFDPPANKYSLIVNIIRGICVYVSGKMGRLAPKAVEIQTPTGVLGTRGTALAVKVESEWP